MQDEDTRLPSSLGFYMPAEWQPHTATWLSWPKDPFTFPKGILPEVENTYCEMIKAITLGEKAKVLVDDGKAEAHARECMRKNDTSDSEVGFFHIKSADVWVRDYGPTFLKSRKGNALAAVKWRFNAWGNKYDELLFDNQAGEGIARAVQESQEGQAQGKEADKFRIFSPDIVMEGGSIDVDGEGTLITTSQCLLNKNRNPLLSKNQIEKHLMDYLGVNGVIWLSEGIEGDDTDGHVDDFCRFVAKDRVVISEEQNPSDPNRKALAENRRIIEKSGLEAIPLPMPSSLIDENEKSRLPASHANFLICNKAVLLPAFGGKSDCEAESVLKDCFPGRKIVPINCRELVFGFGGIHCVTQQEPAL